MNLPIELLGDLQGKIAQATAAAAISGVWQGVLLVATTGVLLKMLPRTTAAVRFAVWAAVFCVAAGLPVAGVLRSNGGAGHATALTTHWHADPRWSYLLAGLWLVAAVVRLGHLIFQAAKLRAMWKNATPLAVDGKVKALLDARRVELCISTEIDRPSVIGFFAPKILIPEWLYEQLSESELHHIVLHEMEHLRRRDDWMNLLQKVGLVLFPLNPALLWVDQRLAAERELACDDGVLRKTQMPRAYATCLTAIAERRMDHKLHRRITALALGVTGAGALLRRRPEFSRRIESILSGRQTASPMVAGVLAVVVAGGAIGLAHAPQLVSFAPIHSALETATVKPAGFERALPAGFRRDDGVAAGAKMVNASFHVPDVTAERKDVAPRVSAKRAKKVAVLPVETIQTKASTARSAEAVKTQTAKRGAQRQPEWFVQTSWEQGAPARVVVKLPDGQFLVVPYAAVPTQAGWLLVQL